MADLDMFCNFGKCRKRLTHFAWVTSCSHAFCEDDGEGVFRGEDGPSEYTAKPRECPACRTPLTKHFDIIKVDLNPTEEFKSMVLTGLRPEILAEIVNRATTFWNYQIYQEYMHQVNSAKWSRESLAGMVKHHESNTNKMLADLQINRKKLEAAQKELEIFAQNTEKLKERLAEKNRQTQKLQQVVDAMRRKTLTSNIQVQEKSLFHYEPRKIAVGIDPWESSHNKTQHMPGNARFEFHPVTPTWNYTNPPVNNELSAQRRVANNVKKKQAWDNHLQIG